MSHSIVIIHGNLETIISKLQVHKASQECTLYLLYIKIQGLIKVKFLFEDLMKSFLEGWE